MNALELKRKLRVLIKYLKNYYWFAIGVALTIVFLLGSTSGLLQAISTYFDFAPTTISLVTAAYCLYMIYLKKYCVIRIPYSSFFFLYGTDKLRRLLSGKILCQVIAHAIMGCVIFFLLTFLGMDYYQAFMLSINTAVICVSSIFASWIFYNKRNAKDVFYTLIVDINLLLFILWNRSPFTLVFSILAVLVLSRILAARIVVNWSKFNEEMKYISKSFTAGLNLDYGTMMSMSQENLQRDKYKITLDSFSNSDNNIIFHVALLYCLRSLKRLFIIPLILYICNLALAFIVPNFALKIIIAIGITIMQCSIFTNLLTSSISDIHNKSKACFFLGVPRSYLRKTNINMCVVTSLIITILNALPFFYFAYMFLIPLIFVSAYAFINSIRNIK